MRRDTTGHRRRRRRRHKERNKGKRRWRKEIWAIKILKG